LAARGSNDRSQIAERAGRDSSLKGPAPFARPAFTALGGHGRTSEVEATVRDASQATTSDLRYLTLRPSLMKGMFAPLKRQVLKVIGAIPSS
jgi:hypothetical protein